MSGVGDFSHADVNACVTIQSLSIKKERSFRRLYGAVNDPQTL